MRKLLLYYSRAYALYDPSQRGRGEKLAVKRGKREQTQRPPEDVAH